MMYTKQEQQTAKEIIHLLEFGTETYICYALYRVKGSTSISRYLPYYFETVGRELVNPSTRKPFTFWDRLFSVKNPVPRYTMMLWFKKEDTKKRIDTLKKCYNL